MPAGDFLMAVSLIVGYGQSTKPEITDLIDCFRSYLPPLYLPSEFFHLRFYLKTQLSCRSAIKFPMKGARITCTWGCLPNRPGR